VLSVSLVKSQQSLCDKYSAALMKNNNQTVSAVVNGTVNACLNATNGIRGYFDGTKTFPGSKDFTATANAAAFQTLFDHLVQFFGQAAILGCTDMTISAYAGIADLAVVHQPMNIDWFGTAKFNELLVGVMRSVGVVDADLKSVATLLYGTRAAICKTGDVSCTTFCSNYTLPGVTSGKDLMTAVVNGSINAALGAPSLRVYFDGTKQFPGSKNFTAPANAAAFQTLFDHLVQFFGNKTILGCYDGSIPPYSGVDMKTAHNGMGINTAEFDAFRDAIGTVAASAGVTAADVTYLKALIDTTRGDIVAASTTVTSATSNTKTSTSNTATTGTGTSTSTKSTTTTSTTSTPSTTDTGTGFGMILVFPLYSLITILLF
jgi:hypothetical protein